MITVTTTRGTTTITTTRQTKHTSSSSSCCCFCSYHHNNNYNVVVVLRVIRLLLVVVCCFFPFVIESASIPPQQQQQQKKQNNNLGLHHHHHDNHYSHTSTSKSCTSANDIIATSTKLTPPPPSSSSTATSSSAAAVTTTATTTFDEISRDNDKDTNEEDNHDNDNEGTVEILTRNTQSHCNNSNNMSPIIRSTSATILPIAPSSLSSSLSSSITTTAGRPTSTNMPLHSATASMTTANLQPPTDQPPHQPLKKSKQSSISKLTLIRLLFITYYGSLGALMPYLPVYFHSLGHTGQSIGLLGSIKPLTTFLVAPLWGILSDYIQNPSFILYITFLSSFFCQLLLPVNEHSVLYLVSVVFVTAFFNAPVKGLIDSMVMNSLDDDDNDDNDDSNNKNQYGKLRLWGQLGFGLGSSFVGQIMSRSTTHTSSSQSSYSSSTSTFTTNHDDVPKMDINVIQTITNFFLSNPISTIQNMSGYHLAFVAYAILSIPSFIAIQSFRTMNHHHQKTKEKELQLLQQQQQSQTTTTTTTTTKKSTSPKIIQGLNMLLHHNDALLFFTLVLIIGITSGIIENFAYVRIREVGGTGREMGICRLISSFCGAPTFYFSNFFSQHYGVDKVLIFSLLSYVVRFLNYALMTKPYHALPAEAMRGIAFAAFWSTGTVFAHKISPPGMSVTMIMFMNAMYGGLGQSTGAIIGGKLQSKVGTIHTFLYSALVDFLFVCGMWTYLSIRKDSSFKNPKPITIITELDDNKDKED